MTRPARCSWRKSKETVNIVHPATGEKAVSIDNAKLALWEAQNRCEKANAERDAARRVETTALHELNKAQEIFDAAVADVRAQAPRDSDWKRVERRGEAVDVP